MIKADQVAQLSEWHVELLQQQAQLDVLKVRLSQHHHPDEEPAPQSHWQPRRQQMPARLQPRYGVLSQHENTYREAAPSAAATSFNSPALVDSCWSWQGPLPPGLPWWPSRQQQQPIASPSAQDAAPAAA